MTNAILVHKVEGVLDPADIDVEDGGMALIGQLDEADPHFFVRLQSWDPQAKGRRISDLPPGAHDTFRRLVGKKVRVTVEILD